MSGRFPLNVHGITPSESAVLDYIVVYIQDNGFSPSYDEIAKEMGWSSKSSVHRYVFDLAERGCVRFVKNAVRSVYPTDVYLNSRRDIEISRLIRLVGSDNALDILRKYAHLKNID